MVEVAPRVHHRHGHVPANPCAVGVLHVAPRPGDLGETEMPLLVERIIDVVVRRHFGLGVLGKVLGLAHVSQGEVDDVVVGGEERRRLFRAHAVGDVDAHKREAAEPAARGDGFDAPQAGDSLAAALEP